jgi:hypothetical protein
MRVMSFGLHMMKSVNVLTPWGSKENLLRGILPMVWRFHIPNVWYLNLVDWSSHNVLAVGLGNCVVYLWNACSIKVSNHG